MKKSKFCYVMTLVLIISMLASMPVFAAYTTVEDEVADSTISCDEWINEEGKYEFPITQYDDEWYELADVTEMRAVTQIPEEILEKISTEDLVQLVLEYPLLCDLNAFLTIEEGY